MALGAYYKAMGGLAKSQRRAKTTQNIISELGSGLIFGVGEAKKAKTAWGEYEAGYKELGGDPADIDKGGWFSRTFKGPGEGQVEIGKGRKYKTYDMQQVRKAGAFLGSDASAILDDEARTKYLERTAPGVEKTRHHDPTKSYPKSYQQIPIDPSTIDPGTGTGFVPTPISPKHERMMRVRSATTPTTGPSQQMPIPARDTLNEYVSGGDPWGVQKMRVADSKNIPEFTVQQPIDTSYEFGKGGGKKQPSIWSKLGSNIENKLVEGIQGFKGLFEKDKDISAEPMDTQKKYDWQLPFKSYAKGGSFVTNGPQMIMVGDNPGGKEAVNIIPLSKEKLGRGKDNKIRNVDGEPSHVNPYEAYLIDTYKDQGEKEVKRIGSGEVNPNTGLKEYQATEAVSAVTKGGGEAVTKGGGGMGLLGGIGLGLQAVSMIMGGFSALENREKVKEAKAGIDVDFNEQIRKLTEAKDREFNKIDTQYEQQTQQLNVGTETALGDTTQVISDIQTKQGFEVGKEATIDTSDMLSKYNTATQNLVSSRELARESSLVSRSEGIGQAEDQRDRMLAELEGIETDFIGGMFS